MLNITPAKMFFNAKPVMRAVDKATRRVLSKAGAFVRRRARSLVRNRKRRTLPGEPPASRTGLLRRFIYFAYDRSSRSVVIGPARFQRGTTYGPVTVPEVLEEGGTVTAPRRGKRKTLRFRGNPYMGPALEAERPNLPALWANSVRR